MMDRIEITADGRKMVPHPCDVWTRGKQAPLFKGRTDVNPVFDFGSLAGRSIVLMFYGGLERRKSRDALQAVYTKLRSRFDDVRAVFFGVCIDSRDRDRGVRDSLPGIRVFWDDDLRISRLYGAVAPDQQPRREGKLPFFAFSLVLDSRLRVYDCIPIESSEQHTRQLSLSLESLLAEERGMRSWMNAPVLIVPNVFPRSFCDHLIDLYRRQGGSPSGTMVVKGGKTVCKMDRSFKRRSDCQITDPLVIDVYCRLLADHLFPQIRTAFHFSPDHVERFLVACYDGEDQAYFRAHRDNTTPGTAHRRFACTINLNAEEYSGGDLRFPEYGKATYRAPTGGAVVFSGSMLHEVLPVTNGQRYATLPFIHDAAAEIIRRQNKSTLSSEVIHVDRPSLVRVHGGGAEAGP
jgi:peroxiredoxin